MKTFFAVSLLVILVLVGGCLGISAETYAKVLSERDMLEDELDGLKRELSAVSDCSPAMPLSGFSTVSEFKDWITEHEQPETTYFSDAFLAALKVQEQAAKDGYLMGISIDILAFVDGEEANIGVTTFLGDELYWWFVEDIEEYYPLDLTK